MPITPRFFIPIFAFKSLQPCHRVSGIDPRLYQADHKACVFYDSIGIICWHVHTYNRYILEGNRAYILLKTMTVEKKIQNFDHTTCH